jgi:hypothetical protein
MSSLAASSRLTNPAINDAIGNFTTSNQGGTVISRLIQNLLNATIGIVGLVLLVMLVRGGYQYITAGGDKEAVQKAVKTMTTALTGAVILLSLFATIQIVEVLFGISLRTPIIPVI